MARILVHATHGPESPTRAALAFLVEDRLAEFDALAADVNVVRPFHERSDVAIALATK